MLFKDQKRELVKLKAKPGIVEVAQEVYTQAYPFASEANLDDLFEELVTRAAMQLGLPSVDVPVVNTITPEADTIETEEVYATDPVGGLLGETNGN